MRTRIEDLAVWMWAHRRVMLVVIDWTFIGAIFCFFMWASSINQMKAGQDGLSLRDTVMTDTEKIRGMDRRVDALETDQGKQWGAISGLKDSMATLQIDMSAVKADLATVLRFVYAILGAILVKGIIDVLKSRKAPEEKEHSHRRAT